MDLVAASTRGLAAACIPAPVEGLTQVRAAGSTPALVGECTAVPAAGFTLVLAGECIPDQTEAFTRGRAEASTLVPAVVFIRVPAAAFIVGREVIKEIFLRCMCLFVSWNKKG